MAARYGAQPPNPAPKRPKLKSSLSKGDCSHIIRQRGAWWLRQDSKLDDMKEALSPVTDVEHATLHKRRSLHTELFPGKSANDMKKELRELGVQGSSGISGMENLAEALDAALRKGKTKEPLLDLEQQAVLDNWERHTLAVDGGPGSGKTVTLAAFVEHVLSRRPQARVLVLSLDLCTKREITTRLLKRGLTLLQKGKALGSQRPTGCLVSTFALLGFWATNMPDNTNLMVKDEGRCLKQSLSMLRLMPPDDAARCWDWIVVDDAQDASHAHGNILEFLRGQSTHLVLAGTLCQSTHQEEGAWFTTVLERRILNEDLFLLKYNYRSSPKIVHILNAYARANFGKVYVDQTASRADQDDDTVEFTSTPLTQQCAKMVRERLERSDLKDALAVSPVTVNACNEKLTEQIQNSPSSRRPRSHCLVYSTSCSSAVPLSDLHCYVIATSRGVRGAERSRVVLYGVSETFAREGVSRSLLARLMYVAMSRAKDHLHVIADLALSDKNPLNLFAFCAANHEESSPPETLDHVWPIAREPYRYLPRRQPGARGVSNPLQSNPKTHAENNTSTSEAGLPIRLVRSKCYAGIVDGARLGNAMEAVTSLPRSEFFRLARAKLALQSAAYFEDSVNCAYRKMNLPPDFVASCIISVDYESELGMDITEIGAVAFTLDGHVLGTYQHVLPGVTVLPEYEDQNEDDDEPDPGSDAEENQESDVLPAETKMEDDKQNDYHVDDEAERLEIARRIDLLSEATKVCKDILYRDERIVDPVSRLAAEGSHGNENEDSSRPDIEKMTGLKVDDTNDLNHGQRRAVRRFHRWAKHVSNTHCFLHWSGGERRVLDLHRRGQVYDARMLFRAWLEVEDMKRPTGQTLTDCVKQVLGPHFAFQPHRAYEDALATAAVFLVLIKTRD